MWKEVHDVWSQELKSNQNCYVYTPVTGISLVRDKSIIYRERTDSWINVSDPLYQ